MGFRWDELVIERAGDFAWRIPAQGAMRVPGIVFADDRLLEAIRGDSSLEQLANVACLPGIVKNSLAMPDVHSGYGFPVGAVAAFDPAEGVVSPGGVGYDINCGVRLLATDLDYQEVAGRVPELTARLAGDVP